MYVHPKSAAFTKTLNALFGEIDEALEDRWGGSFALHPNRPGRGATCNPEADGLFEVAPDFTPGLGSEQGRGYIVSLRVATLETVPPEQFEVFMEEAAALVRERLPWFFPDRTLKVIRDGKRFKIIGDFSLGEV
ncbi:hypothetical protein FACS189468_8010 [Spirochaetia bacterium]|nr:hypothetical protein FACS189468_8010 [Spirochaetia bacterium]